jgi:starch phosphorylase
MKPVFMYRVVPYLPKRLSPLKKLAYNLWWTWHPEANMLFQRLDADLWEATGHNPVALLGRLDPSRLKEILKNEGFLVEMDRVYSELIRYLGEKDTYYKIESSRRFTVAYFSAEYGLSDCLPVYSGGLGILAGDALKSASDLRIPLVGVGLLYQEGYFRQYLNFDGWQLESYQENDVVNLPITLVHDDHGEPMRVDVPIGDRQVNARIWLVQVGRIPLYLLDTNNLSNLPKDRDITAQLYGGDSKMRIQQELVLGIGGIRALAKLKLTPSYLHMNEGHSAFACLEWTRTLMNDHGLTFEEARSAVNSISLFTTHTSVPAGIDVFDPTLLDAVLSPYLRSIGLSLDQLLDLGRIQANEPRDGFSMAVFALRMAGNCNAVSNLHKTISQSMFASLWPEVPLVDVPIRAITNGVHIASWISNDMAGLYDRYLGARWREDPDNLRIWERVDSIPDTELWRTHERRRERLVAFCRRRLQAQLHRRGASTKEVQLATEVLNPEAMTIGFARRFATYKRGDLIFHDPDRLARILGRTDQPVQIIFAGKAHPHDTEGKQVIRNIIHFTHEERFRTRVVFIEDYDMNVARYLVQGVDVWLNNPRRPMEACGTSGMKAAANGALNLSVLDGWWCEGYHVDLGWSIGAGEEYTDPDYQDEVESRTIYDMLENSVVPLFYDRGRDKIPRGWVTRMKNSLRSLCARFNTHRMMEDYFDLFYQPSDKHWEGLSVENFAGARDFQSWKATVAREWNQIRVVDVQPQPNGPITLGKTLRVNVRIHLGKILPQDICANLYYGRLDSKASFLDRSMVRLSHASADGDGHHVFSGKIPCLQCGKFGFRVMVLPSHSFLSNPYSLGLVLWS